MALDEKSKLSDTQDLHADGPMPKILKSVKPFSRFSRSKPFWPFINLPLYIFALSDARLPDLQV